MKEFFNIIDKATRWIIQPSRAIQDTEERSRVQILCALLFLLMVPVIVFTALLLFSPSAFPHALSGVKKAIVLVNLTFCLGSYIVSRTKYYRFACAISVASTVGGACFGGLSAVQTGADVYGSTVWITVTTLICGLVLTPRAVLGTLTLIVVGYTYGFFEVPRHFWLDLLNSATVNLIVGAMIYANAVMRNRAESKLSDQNAALFQASKLTALGEMAGGIAHEINNPLSVIITQAGQMRDIAEDRSEPLDPILIAGMTERIERTAMRIAKIVRSMKHFSREGAADPMKVESAKDIVEVTLELCRDRFRQQGIDVKLNLGADEGASLLVECRSVQISQVLLNLLNNSIDAVLSKKEKWIELSIEDRGHSIEFSVKDCGLGVSESIKQQIFRPFFTTKEIGKGTGLGLSISSGIIESHQGRLWIDEDCSNTRFVFSVPKAQSRGSSENIKVAA